MGSNPDDWSMKVFPQFLLQFSSGRPLVAIIYTIGVVKRFCTLKLGLKTVIFEFQLLSTTEMVYLSCKFHLALVLTMPGR